MINDKLLENRLNAVKKGKVIPTVEKTDNKEIQQMPINQHNNIESTEDNNTMNTIISSSIELTSLIIKSFALGYLIKAFGVNINPLECIFVGFGVYTVFAFIRGLVIKQ